MDTHYAHDQKFGVHGGVGEDSKHWLGHGLTRDGLKKLQDRAQRGEEVHFIDGEGNKLKMLHDEEHGFTVDIRHSH
ncbi:MAG: hypothetical protein WC884_02095 [Candidatus Paceibacterota bacterium]